MTYGWQTKSWRNSTEKKQVDRERKEFTARYLAGDIKFEKDRVPLICYCRSFELGHLPARHQELLSDFDWRLPEERQGQVIFEERIR
jgi:hypothetical protein